ncbi:MAG: type III-B CRISPR module RAMP protein Cmr1 [Firmicutes bacterium]|jgi:CRISPR-associated protein Cmr1|nr:type III-B CRISPR module RAMP protein Cmr1 [Bacillota bacterium]
MRNIPECPPRPEVNQRADWVRKELRIETITPMLGGGVTPLQLDRHSYVRGGTIRGLLRYWWRACQIHSDFQQLYEREKEIFGAASSPGRLTITVGEVEAERFSENDRDFPDAVRFPFMGRGVPRIAEQSARVEFALRLEYPVKYRRDIEDALWAWANFGGIGMRTRRGAGALFIREYAPESPRKLRERLTELWGNGPQGCRSWSLLTPRLFWDTRNQRRQANETWKQALNSLFRFRQVPHGRRDNESRSRWPEADSIRRITNRAHRRHRQSITGDNDAFPRAELGLPLIIRFKDNDEPRAVTISPLTTNPYEGSRRPSPVILRPLKVEDGQIYPMALIMCTPPLRGVRLGPDGPPFGEEHVRGVLVRSYANSPLDKFRADSALEAFENMLRREWRC